MTNNSIKEKRGYKYLVYGSLFFILVCNVSVYGWLKAPHSNEWYSNKSYMTSIRHIFQTRVLMKCNHHRVKCRWIHLNRFKRVKTSHLIVLHCPDCPAYYIQIWRVFAGFYLTLAIRIPVTHRFMVHSSSQHRYLMYWDSFWIWGCWRHITHASLTLCILLFTIKWSKLARS